MKGYIMTNTNMQNLLDNDKYFVQNDQYLVIEPGLTDKNFEQVISHNELLETMSSTNSETPFDCFRVLPLTDDFHRYICKKSFSEIA